MMNIQLQYAEKELTNCNAEMESQFSLKLSSHIDT